MRLTFALCLVAAALGTAMATFAGAVGNEVAIIVNKANKIETISAKDLKAIFSGEKARWPDGSKVQTLATSATMPEHKSAIKFLYGMSEPEFQKYCIHASFVGEPQRVPRDSGASGAVVGMVAATPGAVGFVRASAVTPTVKVLKVDGMAPGDPGYPVTGEP